MCLCSRWWSGGETHSVQNHATARAVPSNQQVFSSQRHSVLVVSGLRTGGTITPDTATRDTVCLLRLVSFHSTHFALRRSAVVVVIGLVPVCLVSFATSSPVSMSCIWSSSIAVCVSPAHVCSERATLDYWPSQRDCKHRLIPNGSECVTCAPQKVPLSLCRRPAEWLS